MSCGQRRCPYLMSWRERRADYRLQVIREYCIAYSDTQLRVPSEEEKVTYCSGEGFLQCPRYQHHDQWVLIAA
jgi:hypothetical protein